MLIIDNSFLISHVDQMGSPFYFAADKDANRENGRDVDNADKNYDGDVTGDIDNDGTKKIVSIPDNKNATEDEIINDGVGDKERSTTNDDNITKAHTDTDTTDKANIKSINNNEKQDINGNKEEKSEADVESREEGTEKGHEADRAEIKDEDVNEGKGDKTQDKEEGKNGPEYEPLGPHPHAGVRYPDGRYGYVADLKAVQNQHFQLGS